MSASKWFHRYRCERCGEGCELNTEEIRVPFRCPMGRDADWRDADDEDEEECEE